MTARPWLALALLALLAAPVAGAAKAKDAGPMEASFTVPAQATGALEGRGQWALLLVHGPAGFDFSLPAGATVANTTVLQWKRGGGDNVVAPLILPARSTTLGAASSGRLGFSGAAWGALFVEADSLRLVAEEGATADLRLAAAGDSARDHLPPIHHPVDAVEPYPGWPGLRLRSGGPAAGALAAGGADVAGLPVTLHATGLQRLYWHNATLACAAGPCPDAGEPATVEAGPLASRMDRLTYVDVASAGGALDGRGTVVAAAVGGPALDLLVAGHVRLPGATLAGDCPGGPCPDPAGRTFLADGRVELTGLAGDGQDPARLRGQLAGRFAAVGFDEDARGEFGAAVAVAAGAAALLAWALKAVAGLFARSARPPALRNPRRQLLHRLIVEEPGLSSRDLQRRAGWATGVFRHHLQRLVEARLVVAQPHRNTLRYFENHARYRTGWRQVLETRGEDAQRLLDLVAQRPGVDQGAVVRATAAWGWTRTTTRRRLRGLEEAGLVAAQRQGRRTLYTAQPAGGAVAPFVPAPAPGPAAQAPSPPSGRPAPVPALAASGLRRPGDVGRPMSLG